MLDRTIIQDVPAPPPSRPLVLGTFKIGISPATGEEIGVDPDGHGVATGGSRTGKSSVMFGILEQLIKLGPDALASFWPIPISLFQTAFFKQLMTCPQNFAVKLFDA